MKEPKDLGIKIGTPEEVFWTDLKKKLEEDVKNFGRQIDVNLIVIEYANKRIAVEKKKLK